MAASARAASPPTTALNVVRWRIGAIFARTARIAGAMLLGIPPATRQVHAAGEREAVVDDDDLLMVAGARRMRAVELQMDARVLEGVAPADELGIAHVREQYGKVPGEDVDVELWIRLGRGRKKLAQRRQQFSAIGRRAGAEPDPTVEVPAEDDDASPGPGDRIRQRGVIIGAVDQQRESIGSREWIAIPSRLEHTRHPWMHRTIDARR